MELEATDHSYTTASEWVEQLALLHEFVGRQVTFTLYDAAGVQLLDITDKLWALGDQTTAQELEIWIGRGGHLTFSPSTIAVGYRIVHCRPGGDSFLEGQFKWHSLAYCSIIAFDSWPPDPRRLGAGGLAPT